jgi:hypothetical protein
VVDDGSDDAWLGGVDVVAEVVTPTDINRREWTTITT